MTLRGLYIAPRAAALLAALALLAVFIPGWWAWLFGAVALTAVVVLVRRDARRAATPADLTWVRDVPARFSIGVPNPVAVTIVNDGAVPARIVARETPPAGFTGERALPTLTIAPRDEACVTLHFTPPSRGRFDFGEPGLRTLGPWGLAGRQATMPVAEEVRVYPDITAVRSYALLARRGQLEEIGVRAARYEGRGTEFESLREYRPGDEFRAIDWKATARRGTPVVRSFEAERSRTIVVAIDAGRLMQGRVGDMTRLDRAVNAALLVSWLALAAGDNVGLLVFGRGVETYVPPAKGDRRFRALLEALYAVEGRLEEPDYRGAFGYLAARLPRRALVVVFTELVGTEPSMRLLRTLSALMPRHLPLVLTQRDRALEAAAAAVPTTESGAFAAAVADDMLGDKAAALAMLTSRGALALDVDPEALSVAAVNRYLEAKARGQL